MKDLFFRFTSRKFLFTIVVLAYAFATANVELIQWTLTVYVGAEGAADVVKRYKESKTTVVSDTAMSHNDDTPDTSHIVTGTGRIARVDEELDK